MKHHFKHLLTIILTVYLSTGCQTRNETTLNSPNGKLQLNFSVDAGIASYSFGKNGYEIIKKSGLGFEFKNMPPLKGNLAITGIDTSSANHTWEQPWGETRFVNDRYNQMVVHLQETTVPKRRLDVIFKLYDDGIGFRYHFPAQTSIDSLIIADEITEFNLSGDFGAWWIPVHGDNSYYESLPRHTPISRTDTVNTPLTMQVNDSLYIAIHEANLTDYASMTLLRTHGHHLKSELVPWANGVKVYAQAPFSTPWRTIVVGEKPGDLITSTLMLNLNEPCQLTDRSWVKPSKYIGIWWGMHMEKLTWSQGPKHGATTQNTMQYMDFAAQNGFGGVLVEGWNNGWDGDWSHNGGQFSFTQPYPDFDMAKICQYGRTKGVSLVGHHETGGAVENYEKQMDDAFRLYQQNGVHAVKTGYVNKLLNHKEWHDGQFGVRHYRKVIETAAKYQIMIDNHEPVKPTGLCRTFPNFMTQEGGRGQEYDAWSPDGGNPPAYTTVIPFTRMLAGPFDFTPGTFNFTNNAHPHTRVQTTLAKQLALMVVIYSPLQMASDLPENYLGVPAFQFIKNVPCDWAKTVVPNGEIGKYITIARQDRNSEEWFVGAITNEEARDLTLNLSFLNKDRKYKAQIYADGQGADWESNPYPVAIGTSEVDAQTSLTLHLANGGGCAIRLFPIP